jgi:nitrate/TMAO reductase-like tetraheme cytochrome c subunit
MSRLLAFRKRKLETSSTDGNSRRRWPRLALDFGRPRDRRIVALAIGGLMVGLLALLIGAYSTYMYTESPGFCGTSCHPMAPVYARYQSSPHSRVDCVKCHVGPGILGFVKSKLEGTKELVANITDTHSRPITSPVHNLRPARETCEACHTPTSFQDTIVKTIVHFDSDEANTRIQTNLILKMGGLREETGLGQGIHWHINSEVYYIAADEQRQTMLWVGVKEPNGSLKEYFSRDMLGMAKTSFVEQARAEGKVRLMDCIDCHNRTAHNIPTPADAVDRAMTAGLISPNLPSIRKLAIDALSVSYTSPAEANAAFEGLASAYRVDAGGSGQAASASTLSSALVTSSDVERTLAEIKRIYASVNFPEMLLNWQTNPNNENHQSSPGCFRCHDDKHVRVDEAGNEQLISAQCNICHTVPIVARGDERLVEAPVIVGAIPTSHATFKWTTEHRTVTDAQKEECYSCHGKAFCSNAACHNLAHPVDMLYSHANEYRQQGQQVCYTCHQNVLCSRCHPSGNITNR